MNKPKIYVPRPRKSFAIQWTGDNLEAIQELLSYRFRELTIIPDWGECVIVNAEDQRVACRPDSDWIVVPYNNLSPEIRVLTNEALKEQFEESTDE